mgnify:CR=1 FL=1
MLVCPVLYGQDRFVSVLREQTLTLDQQLDSVMQEFGQNVGQELIEQNAARPARTCKQGAQSMGMQMFRKG